MNTMRSMGGIKNIIQDGSTCLFFMFCSFIVAFPHFLSLLNSYLFALALFIRVLWINTHVTSSNCRFNQVRKFPFCKESQKTALWEGQHRLNHCDSRNGTTSGRFPSGMSRVKGRFTDRGQSHRKAIHLIPNIKESLIPSVLLCVTFFAPLVDYFLGDASRDWHGTSASKTWGLELAHILVAWSVVYVCCCFTTTYIILHLLTSYTKTTTFQNGLYSLMWLSRCCWPCRWCGT